MKKTLILTLEYPPQIGGIATYIDQFAGSLDKDDVVVMAPPMKDDTKWDNERPFNILRKKFYFPKFIWPRWFRLYFTVKKFVKQYQVDVIHVHHALPVGYIARKMKKKFGIPYIIFSHGTDVAAVAAQKRKRKRMVDVGLDADLILTNSNNLKERLLKAFPEFQDKTKVLYPCPEQMFLTPPPQSDIDALTHQYALEGKKVLLTVSRLEEGKGLPHLVRLMPTILERVPSLVWFIVGDGSKRESLLEDIRKHNLQNIVRFIGEVEHKELKKYYHIADIFVLLTHPDNGFEEGLGLVFLEAATAGLPIVAGLSGGVPEAVLHEKTGLVIDVKQNPEEIIEAIVKMINEPEYAKHLGTAGQERILKEFVWSEQLKVIEDWM